MNCSRAVLRDVSPTKAHNLGQAETAPRIRHPLELAAVLEELPEHRVFIKPLLN